jgi:hypothetical protein
VHCSGAAPVSADLQSDTLYEDGKCTNELREDGDGGNNDAEAGRSKTDYGVTANDAEVYWTKTDNMILQIPTE